MLSQVSLKSQDIVVALKVALSLGEGFTYARAGMDLGLSASRVHASMKMLVMARLAAGSTKDGVSINKVRLLELLVYGVPSFFPAVLGSPTRGVPTFSALREIQQQFVANEDSSYVWPDAAGETRGVAIAPLHPCVVKAVRKDEALYRALMAIDTLRIGGAREREIGIGILKNMFG